MGLNSKHHHFLVSDIKEIDLCGKKLYEITGSDFSKPTDFIRIRYENHNLDTCEDCKKSHSKVFSEIELKFRSFPTCCEPHTKLLKEKWFDRRDFESVPKMHADKLYYTWHHILNFIDSDNWREEIIDFTEYIFETFGSFPIDYGEPLYFRTFVCQLEELVKQLTESEVKRKVILEFIQNYRIKAPASKTDFNILIGVYNDWYRTFPFELSFFSHLKSHFANHIPLFEKIHFNKYLNLAKATPRTKESLIGQLIRVTEKIISEINTVSLYESGQIDDINKLKIELVVQERKQKIKDGYSISHKDRNRGYRRILKEWLKDEFAFVKKIEHSLRAVITKKESLYINLLNACFTMQENKIFWNADENARTRQILDLMSSNYFTKDQATYGKSETGKKPGSVDGVIIDESKTEHFVEAFNLNSLNKEIIRRHIHKVESNYDSKGILSKFLLIYCNIRDNAFGKLFESYFDYINDELEYKFAKTEIVEEKTKYTNIKFLKSLHQRGSKSDTSSYFTENAN